jgi:YD repeat-containing protein
LLNNGNKIFVYNEDNRLIEVKDINGTSIATFTYDHEGKRTSIKTANGLTNLHYSGDKVIYETDANNSIIASYTWDTEGKPVTMKKKWGNLLLSFKWTW